MEFQSNELLSVLAYACQPSRDALHFNTALDIPPHRHRASSAFTTVAPLNATALKFHTSFRQEGQIFPLSPLIFHMKI